VRFLLEHLNTHTELPPSVHDARVLLDEVGIEVKTVETTPQGTVFNCELLANRGDHYCYNGVAREVTGRTGRKLNFPQGRKMDVVAADPARVKIETPLCLVYTVTELVRGNSRNLPDEILRPLLATGVHSINEPVDASNLTNFDIGQPTHAFDADKIDGPITIRLSREGEKALLLFTTEHIEVPAGTLVIADDSKILGIAGVIGCADSGVDENTTRILLESACFDPVAVRVASRQLNQATDAAARFMRGGDPTLPVVGASRVAYLLEKYAGYGVGKTYVAGDWSDPQRKIEVRVAHTNRFIGTDMSALEMAERLTRYGFAVEVPEVPSRTSDASPSASTARDSSTSLAMTLTVAVPPHRLWDVHFEADLAEELLKSVGYDNTPITLPRVDMGALPSHAENVAEAVNEVLVGEGFFEIFTDSFYGRGVREKLGLDEGDPLYEHVEMQNSIERNYSLMRNNTVAQALEAFVTNANLKNTNLKIFEWARIYFPDLSEKAVLWLLVNGRDRGPFWGDKGRAADAIYLKGIVEQLRLELRIDLQAGASDGHRLERFFHPGRRAGIHANGTLVGIFGELHPQLLQRFDVKRQRPVYLEIDVDALQTEPRPRTYAEPSNRQPVLRNVAFALPRGITAASVRDALASAAPPFLRELRITDLFELPDARAVTFEIEYLAEEALTGETINAATESMIAAVKAAFGETVTQRA
jgi:phenylalanyl-tRNA synthetase beta chain